MDEKALNKIAESVVNRDIHDHILAWDKKQGGERREGQRMCPKHGNRLTMRGDGNMLICGVTRPAECRLFGACQSIEIADGRRR